MRLSKSIILEGPNGAGKSYLAKLLSVHYNMSVYHAGQAPQDNEARVMCCDEQLEWVTDGPCIIDRCTPISDTIYQCDLDMSMKSIYQKYLDIMLPDVVLIYCNNPVGPTDKPEYPEGHYQKICKHFTHICSKYDDMMGVIDHFVWDKDIASFEDLIVFIDAVGGENECL